MTKDLLTVNETSVGSIAPLKNVALFTELVDRVVNRHPDLPGIATFHGFSGFGKTFSATYAAHKYRAYYVEMGESWSRVRLIEAICHTVGLPKSNGTIAAKVEALIEALFDADRPLIIDEADYLFTRKMHELIREIHDNSGVPIILIGEELLPRKIQGASERFHNRVMDWVAAQPVDADDARHLRRLYCNNIEISDELYDRVLKASSGRARRLCVNLSHIAELARLLGAEKVTAQEWGDRPLFTGQPPIVRAA